MGGAHFSALLVYCPKLSLVGFELLPQNGMATRAVVVGRSSVCVT